MATGHRLPPIGSNDKLAGFCAPLLGDLILWEMALALHWHALLAPLSAALTTRQAISGQLQFLFLLEPL